MHKKEYTTEAIAKGLFSDDPDVYRHLEAMYRPKVVAHVRKNSGTKEDAEELYQDVIFDIYLNIEQGKFEADKGNFEAYFMTITRRRWIDKIRKQRNLISTTTLEESNRQVSDTDFAMQDEKDAYNEKVRAMQRYIQQLKHDERELINLYYFAQKSVEATADQAGITYNYAKQKLHRIREKLRVMAANDPMFGTLGMKG